MAAARPLTSPLRGYHASDLVRDVVAVVLLFWSLFLPWNLGGLTAQLWAPLVATLISLLSVGVTYLTRSGVMPAGAVGSGTIRLLAAIPYGLAVVTYLLIDVITDGAVGLVGGHLSGGVGSGLAIGLAGAVLAAQPRLSDVGDEASRASAVSRWRMGALVVAGLVAVAAIVSFVFSITTWIAPMMSFSVGNGILALLLELVLELGIAVVLAGPLLLVARGQDAWRLVAVALGAGATVAVLAGLSNHVVDLGWGVGANLYSMRSAGFAFVLAPLVGALAACPVLTSRPALGRDVPWWFAVARNSFLLQGIYGLFSTLIVVLLLILQLTGGDSVVGVWKLLVPALPLAAIGLIGFFAARGAGQRARQITLVLAIAALIVGVVVGVLALTDVVPMRALDFAAYFGLPVLALLTMTVPAAVQQWVQTLPRATSPAAQATYGAGVPGPSVPAPAGTRAPQYPAPDPVALEAANPATPQARLAQIAQFYPAYHAIVAANPACYPQLREWIDAQAALSAPHASPSPVASPSPAQGAAEQTLPVSQEFSQQVPVQQAPAQQADAQHSPGLQAPSEPAPADAAPAQVAQPAAPAPADSVAREAADPATSAARLAEIVQIRPDLRPAVAAHPQCYPGLADWLAQFHDPAIDAALRMRQAGS